MTFNKRQTFKQPPTPYLLSGIYPDVLEVWVASDPTATYSGNTASVSVGTYQVGAEFGATLLMDPSDLVHVTLQSDARALPNYSDNTFSIVRRCRDTTNRDSALFGYDNGNTDRITCHVPWSDGFVYFDCWNATINSGRLQLSGYTKTLEWEVLTFVASATRGREVWINGVLFGSNPAATAQRGGGPTMPFNIGTPSTTGAAIPSESMEVALFVCAGSAWAPALIAKFGENPTVSPWTLFAPATNRMNVLTGTISRPGADVAGFVTGWTFTGASLSASINEVTRNDASYAEAAYGVTGGIVTLDIPRAPGTHTISFASDYLTATATSGQFRFSLLDDTNAVLGTTSWQAVTSTVVQYDLPVTISTTATRLKIEIQA